MDNLKRRNIPGQHDHPSDYMDDHYESQDSLLVDEKEKVFRPVPVQPPVAYSSNKYIAMYQRNRDVINPVVLTLLSFYTRYRIIGRARKVVWDEASSKYAWSIDMLACFLIVHYHCITGSFWQGTFASHYLKREFYFDVHPPLGKMLNALAGLLAGYDGSYEFKSGESYPDDVNFVPMRIFNATWGALLVPVAYYTAKRLGYSENASVFAAVMNLCDLAYLCISRFILLDSMLLFFTSTTLLALVSFHNERNRPFSDTWWIYLALTGVSLGLVSSVKWVGLFAVALVGLYTIEDLWDKLGDLQMPKVQYAKHFAARAFCLIVLPFTIYILSFVAHFAILSRSGPGDAQMSSLFQANLEGNTLGQNPVDVAYGSKLTIKNSGYGGGLLHSHIQRYPSGSEQQQVTCYHYNDSNNDFIITKRRENGVVPEYEGVPVEYVRDGDVVRLVHAPTRRQLHSHPIKAPVTTSEWEVSAYGDDKVGDENDHWKVEIVDDILHKDADRVRALTTRFRLRHIQLGCLLMANNVNLPQWGFKQIEVICDKGNKTTSPHAMWNVESNDHPDLEPAPAKAYKSPFFRDFWHLNVAMWTSNNALTPDPDREDTLASEPLDWLTIRLGLRMNGWGDSDIKYYLAGNPVVWWSALATIIGVAAAYAAFIIRRQRQIRDHSPGQWDYFSFVVKTLGLGWLLHYGPFFIMGRVTYLHHYFPALYFAILLVPFAIEHATARLSKTARTAVWAVAYTSVIFTFFYLSPFAYGMEGPIDDFKGRNWRGTWNLYEL